MIPVNEPLIGELEKQYVDDCISSGWISSGGPYVERFESEWAAFCGARHGIAVTSGTTALFAAVAALGLERGDEVILPSFTIISCVHAIMATGAVPVLVDCEADTWCMDCDEVEAKITPKTRAIMAVHIYGHPADMGRLERIAARSGVAIIEDAAEAHGAEAHGKRVGGFGTGACFSFYANKIITTGEGGMVVTNDESVAEFTRSYRNLAFREDRRFFHTEMGYNYRLTNLQAAVGLAQVQTADDRIERKRHIGARYSGTLRDIEAVTLPVERAWAKNVYWMYGIVLHEDAGVDAREFSDRLRTRGVDTRPFFVGMHEQPVLLERGMFKAQRFPVTESISRLGLYLPSGLTLTDDEIDVVAGAVRECIGDA